MPLPTPKPGESSTDFMDRCMTDPTMREEYPDEDQRAAVCHSRLEGDKHVKYNSLKAYGDSEGPLGFPMRSEDAKATEALISELPEDCKKRIQDGPIRLVCSGKQPDFKDDERADISWVTTESVDRDNEVVLAKGLNWKQWKKNPVVTFGHNYRDLPVGRGLWVKRETDKNIVGWLAKTRYTSKPEDWGDHPWFPDAVWHFVREGDLPGKSIGFVPLEMRSPKEDEIKKRPELAGVDTIIPKGLILEYAVATVQSNPDALVISSAKAKQKGLNVESILEELGMVLPGPELPQSSPPPPPEEETPGKIVVYQRISKKKTSQLAKKALQEELDRRRGRC
jgi:hypothetical protein